jgi:hypothetical protein
MQCLRVKYGVCVGLIAQTTIFGLPCCSIPPRDMSCGHNSLNTDIASVNQNYAHGAKEARTEMMPLPCSVATWTHNNQSACTIEIACA